MKKNRIVLYIASSLDGRIARTDGALDWLFAVEGDGDNGYAEFFKTIGTVVMGRKTYDEVLMLENGEYPYKETPSYIWTRSKQEATEYVTFTDESLTTLLPRLQEQSDGDIWLVGGGEIIKAALEADLIDAYTIAIAPVILGSGIPLFPEGTKETNVRLDKIEQSGQFAMLHYSRPAKEATS
ncbi:dihydrofolate reductase family protein [Exiguobacterium flavidum]|uniref:dihydrofolate reductase family protein n=1 Tax=Exiguobacterium flavidum TaxID=2184695 RepID=UPI000DF7522F|nr:dihydrofolate reductase family protein [Exiguobacterium flavidum]